MKQVVWPIIGAFIGSVLGLHVIPAALSSYYRITAERDRFEIRRLQIHDTWPGVCPLIDYDIRLARGAHAEIDYTLFRESAPGSRVWVDSGSLSRDLYDVSELPYPLDLGAFTASEIACPDLPGTYVLRVKYSLEPSPPGAPPPPSVHYITEPFVVAEPVAP